jgi:hypothetical protein
MASLAGTTVLTGIYLFWRFTGGFDPTVSGSPPGRAYGIGGLAGLAAAIIGGAVVGRSAERMMALVEQAGPMPDGPARAALLEKVATLRQRVKRASQIVIVLQVIALTLMAIGHYV